MGTATHSELDILVARQPIFNRTHAVVGYELLYRRNAASDTAEGIDTYSMTCTTLADGVLGIGLDDLVGETRAWITSRRNHSTRTCGPCSIRRAA